MSQQALGLGVDFGTSNTAVGYMADGMPRLIQFAPSRTTIPTTFFFDYDARRMLIGDSGALFAVLFESVDWRKTRPERARRPLVAG
jgi:molecular chaperone DnaK (HSP70)